MLGELSSGAVGALPNRSSPFRLRHKLEEADCVRFIDMFLEGKKYFDLA